MDWCESVSHELWVDEYAYKGVVRIRVEGRMRPHCGEVEHLAGPQGALLQLRSKIPQYLQLPLHTAAVAFIAIVRFVG